MKTIPRFVYQLHPAHGTYVPMHAVYGRIDGKGTFPHAGPHWVLSCPTDVPKFQTEVRTIDGWRTPWKHIGRKRPPNGTVVPYFKPGNTPYTAVKQGESFDATFHCTDTVSVHSNVAGRLATAAATSRDRSYRIYWDGAEAALHWFEPRFVHNWRVGSIRRAHASHLINVDFVAVNNNSNVVTIHNATMGLPSDHDFDVRRVWNVIDQVGMTPDSPRPISLLMHGEPGEWLIADPATGSQFIGAGDELPDGFVVRPT